MVACAVRKDTYSPLDPQPSQDEVAQFLVAGVSSASGGADGIWLLFA